ncbi:hypothetical protein QUA56_25805 [Microcoleus sp. N3A4]
MAVGSWQLAVGSWHWALYQFRLRRNDIEDTAVPFPYRDRL